MEILSATPQQSEICVKFSVFQAWNLGEIVPEKKGETSHSALLQGSCSETQRALRDRLMSRGKNCLPTVSRQFLTRNYPRPNCLLKCLPNCLSPTREGFLSSFKINPAVRVIARQVRGKNCLAAIFAPDINLSLLAHWEIIRDFVCDSKKVPL